MMDHLKKSKRVAAGQDSGAQFGCMRKHVYAWEFRCKQFDDRQKEREKNERYSI
jgi:hypothetical protein